MEISKQEIMVVQNVAQKGQEDAIQALSELELVLVGGGTGDVAIG